MANEKKLTKREHFEAIKAKYPLTEDEVKFIDRELELLAKKNASGANRKPTATQKENEVIKTNILEVLADGKQRTVTEIVKVLEGDYTNQKISALVRQLIADGKVEKVVDKRKSYFKAV